MSKVVEVLAIVLGIWLLTTLVVVGACCAAAQGDEREQHRHSAHWGSLER